MLESPEQPRLSTRFMGTKSTKNTLVRPTRERERASVVVYICTHRVLCVNCGNIQPVFWKFFKSSSLQILLIRRERTWIDSYRCETQSHIIDPVSHTVATKS